MDLTSELTENLEKIVIDNKDTTENQQNPKNEEVEESPMESSQHTLSQMVVQRNNSVFPTEGICVGVRACDQDSSSQNEEMNRYVWLCIESYVRMYVHTYVRTYLHTLCDIFELLLCT